MKNRIKALKAFTALLLLIILALNVSGCSKLFGPSDAEVTSAITEMDIFAGGVEKFSLKAPIVILEKGMFTRDGVWPVKVKLIYTYTMAGGRETKPTAKILSFSISKSKDSSGNLVWKAASGPQ